MKNFIETFKTTWEIDIKHRFEKGFIAYERQLQAILYEQLRNRLTSEYEIWVEPVVYLDTKQNVKPDLIITKEEKIISVVELKAKPWDYPTFQHDLDKFQKYYVNLANNEKEITLGWIPKYSDWEVQAKNKKLDLKYTFRKDTIMIFAAIVKSDSDIITNEYKGIRKFIGYIDHEGIAQFKNK